MATDQYIKQNPDVVQTWTNTIYRAQKWTESAPVADIVSAIADFFPGINPKALASSVDRYQKLKIWKNSPVIEPAPIEKFQDILVHGNVLEQGKRVKFQDLVLTDFAAKAK
jgi:NitT/TauT family transport system substrate-binding protein